MVFRLIAFIVNISNLPKIYKYNSSFVFLCLYLFLVGIGGLNGSIKSLTQPDKIEIGDMIQSKVKLSSDEEFIDEGNGKWDNKELFEDLNENDKWDVGEVFTDKGNGVYDKGESFTDSNGEGKWTESKKSKVWLLVTDKVSYKGTPRKYDFTPASF